MMTLELLLSLSDRFKDWEFAPGASKLLLLIPAVAAMVFFLYRGERELSSKGRRNLLIGLRVMALAILLTLFFEPRKVTLTVLPQPSPFIILVDQSRSMEELGSEYTEDEIKERNQGFDKEIIALQEEKATLENSGKLLEAKEIQKRIEAIRVFQANVVDNMIAESRYELQKKVVNEFASDLQQTDGEKAATEGGEENQGSHVVHIRGFGDTYTNIVDTVSWDGVQLGKRTLLVDALNQAIAERRGEDITGILIVTDGNVEDVEAASKLLAKRKGKTNKNMSINVLGVGSRNIKPDLKLTSFAIPEVAIKSKDSVTFRATYSGRGIDPEDMVKLKLFQDGEEVASKEEALKKGEVEFEVVLDKAGKFSYRLELEPVDGERMVDNNQRTAFITVKDEKLKILYIEDYPRYDYRKISQFLERNDNLYESSIWLQQASQHYKQRGSKPLSQSPVITYTNFDKLWKEVDVIFLGNIGSRAFLNSTFLQNIEKFVRKGGGLVFLAGAYNTPSSYVGVEEITNLLPVFLGESVDKEADRSKARFKFQVTSRGQKHPTTRMGDPAITSRAWEKGVPPCYWYYRPAGLKPSATVLIQHPEETLTEETDKNVPIFAVMPYSRGQTYWVGTDEMSRWSFLDNDEYMFNHFMGQLIQYMSSSKVSSGGVVDVDLDTVPVGDTITVSFHLDDAADSTDSVRVVKWVYEGEDKVNELKLNRVSPDSPTYEGKLVAQKKGVISLWMKSKEHAKQVSVTGYSRELESNELNQTNLTLLAGETGSVVQIEDLKSLAAKFKMTQITKDKLTTKSLLDSGEGQDKNRLMVIIALLVLLTLLLGTEWWLRKRWHLL